MRRALLALMLVALLVAPLACGSDDPRPYSDNDLMLINGYSAKEMCSCLFVMQHDEEFCRAWAKQSPAVVEWQIDTDAKVVRTSGLFLWTGQARWDGPEFGCVLE